MKRKWVKPGLSSFDILWHSNCDLLEEHYRLYGTCNCNIRAVCILPDGTAVKLGQWLDNQRKLKNRGALQRDREERLQILVDQGKLSWELNRRNWDFMYDLLIEYGRQYGTCNVPVEWEETLSDGEVVRLGHWVHTQRITRDTTMSKDHRRRLQELVEKGAFSWHEVRIH